MAGFKTLARPKTRWVIKFDRKTCDKNKEHVGFKEDSIIAEAKDGFATFWQYVVERSKIEAARRAGKPAPWTKIPLLRVSRFCSINRIADNACQFLIERAINIGDQSLEEVLFRVCLFTAFNRCETWEMLEEAIGPLTWKDYDRRTYTDVCLDAKERNVKLYTGAYQKHAPKHPDHHQISQPELHLLQVEQLMSVLVSPLSDPTTTAENVFDIIIGVRGFQEFMTMQLIQNLSYSKWLILDEDDIIRAGPGAKSGLKLMFKFDQALDSENMVAVLRWIQKHQWEHFKHFNLKYHGLVFDGKPTGMSLWDVEHTVCEVYKFIKDAPRPRNFNTAARRFPPAVVFPNSWSDPRRHASKATVAPEDSSESDLTELSEDEEVEPCDLTELEESDKEKNVAAGPSTRSRISGLVKPSLCMEIDAFSADEDVLAVASIPVAPPCKTPASSPRKLVRLTAAAQARTLPSPVVPTRLRTKRPRTDPEPVAASTSRKRTKTQKTALIAAADEGEQYLVERIVEEKKVEKKLQYLIKWENYSEAESTWEPAGVIWKDAPNAVRDWKENMDV